MRFDAVTLDVFNHLRPSLERKSQDALIKYANEDPRITALNANRLLTHIFPRQFPSSSAQLSKPPVGLGIYALTMTYGDV